MAILTFLLPPGKELLQEQWLGHGRQFQRYQRGWLSLLLPAEKAENIGFVELKGGGLEWIFVAAWNCRSQPKQLELLELLLEGYS